MTDTPASAAGQKRPGRRPAGPAHARDRSALQALKRTFTEFSEDNLPDSAAALTYYAVLSIFPALIAMISIVGLVGDPQTGTKSLADIIASIGPASAAETFKGPIEGLAKSGGAAGILLMIGIASALWTASGYVGAFMRASNVIYEVEEASPPPEVEPLRDPLSDAELRVLRYLPSNLKAPEIASELCVSANTVRTHVRHLYAKLDAHSRSEAVSRARQNGLLAPARA